MEYIGYARVSTEEQHLDAQIEQLKAAGCVRLYEEKASGVKEDRPELSKMLGYIRESDVVVVCKLDRIARSTKHLLQIVETLGEKKVSFKVLNIDLDTSTPTGKLMLSMLAAIGQFEREMMLERQKEGIRIAKEKGKYNGRKPTAQNQAVKVLELLSQGKTRQSVADELKIGIASVYRILKQTGL